MIRTAITPRFLCTTLGQLRATPLRSFSPSLPHYTFHRPIRCFSTTQLRSSVTQPTDAETERHQAAVGEEQAAQDLGMKQPRMRHWPKDDKPLRDMNSEGKEGQLLSTPSRLLKLVLPLHPPKLDSTDSKQPSESPPAASTAPLAILAHPGQPLSYLERLISSELPPIASPSRPRSIHFLAPNTPTDATTFPAPSEPTLVRYSPATELGDFLRDASKSSFFLLHIEGSPSPIRCSVPSFLSRTYYLRLRLRSLSRSLATQTALKAACDAEAHKGAKRAALSGLGGLISWWAGVAYATFYTPLGWEVMEPVTYLVGLSGVISGYLWFLWHDREVSYRNWQHLAVTRRQARLYEEKGFDMERWQELVQEARRVRREVREVAGEFGVEWDGREEGIGEGEDGEVVKEVLDREDDSARGKGVIEDREREIKEDMERDKKELKDEREKAKREKEQQAKG